MAEKKQPNGTSKPIDGSGKIVINSQSGGSNFVKKTQSSPPKNSKK